MQVPSNPSEQKISNPMLILHRQLKDKTLKKSSLQSLTTISIALGRKKTRQQLIPYLGNIFVEQNVQMQKIILKGLTQLLHPIYIGKSHHSKIILELIIDILCVYSNKQIRDEAYICLQKVFAVIDVRKAQNILVQALKKLNSQQQDPNIRQLVLKLIPYVYAGVDGQKQKQLLVILNSYKNKLSDQKLLSQTLCQFIKVMPPAPQAQIRQIISILLKTDDKQILCNLIQPIILLTRVSGQQTTQQYLKQILSKTDTSVICTTLKKYMKLSQVFNQDSLSPLTNKITQYNNQPQQIKNTILQILDQLPIAQQQMINLTQPPSGLQLKTTLSQTLCRVNDLKSLLKLFNSSDANFQIKLFPKLPKVQEMHVEMLDKIMASKSWRQKIVVLQNVDLRSKNGEQTYLFLDGLSVYLGDKIACVRVAVAATMKNILIEHKISLLKIPSIIKRCLDSKNWFERQALYKFLQDLIKDSKQVQQNIEEKNQILRICQIGKQQKIANIKDISIQIQRKLNQL